MSTTSHNIDVILTKVGGNPKKLWIDCMQGDMARKGMTKDLTTNREANMEAEDMFRRLKINWVGTNLC